MMAQPQLAQGCAVCGAPSDPLDERREPAKRAVCRGRRLLVLFAKESGLSKVTRPSPKGGRNPVEGSALASFKLKAKPSACRQTGEPKRLAPLTLTLSPKGRGDQTEGCRGFGRPQTKTAAPGLRFFYLANR